MKTISIAELKAMLDRNEEALVLQGCGGDLDEWVDGINETLTQEGILLEGSRFTNVSTFKHEGLTNLVFPFEDAKLDAGKLAIWRLASHNAFGGTWLSDYGSNRLKYEPAEQKEEKEPVAEKPKAPIIGADGNIFNVLGIATRALKRAGQYDEASEMSSRVTSSDSYPEALGIIQEYVEPVDTQDMVEQRPTEEMEM